MKSIFLSAIAIAFLATACNNDAGPDAGVKDSTKDKESDIKTVSVKEEPLNYSTNGVSFKSFAAYDESRTGKRPIVLIVPEWWGLTNYPRMRAKMLAELGYLAIAVDMYGDGKVAANPDEAGKAAGAFYSNPQMGKERLDAALASAKALSQADTTQTVAIGYCFGGSMVLNYAKQGGPVVGVVSFHGNLDGVPPQKGTKAQFLICHGGADSFVPQKQVDAFKKSMDSAGLSYGFKVYDNATHAFTNPDATANGEKFKMPIKYNGAADTASWNDMKAFFGKVIKK